MPAYIQVLDPCNQRVLSTALAALPVFVLFWLLVVRHRPAPIAGAAGAGTAILIAWLGYGMPLALASTSFLHGAAFGLLPVGWLVFSAMLLYNLSVRSGQFAVLRRSVAHLSDDMRVQAILVGFSFGAFLEGAAGMGTPVAICGAILVGLGFDPFKAAVLCLIANTSPVAYGALGLPLLTLEKVTDLPAERLSVMAGHQLPLLSCIVPFWMVKSLWSWRETMAVWPVLVVAGGSFAVFQFTFATVHTWVPGLVLFPLTDIGGGLFSLIVSAIFLRYWQPRDPIRTIQSELSESPLTRGQVVKAWMPYVLMSALLMGAGLLRQNDAKAPIAVGPVKATYSIQVPILHRQVERAAQLSETGDRLEKAEFTINWMTTPGSAVMLAAVITALALRMPVSQLVEVLQSTARQMRIPIPTIVCMIGLSYVTRYSGMDATLGVAFASTGLLYPFFAAILGWLGVFLTGSDAGSNALFGNLQKITATRVYDTGAFTHLSLDQAQVLMCTANSTGGVMGKMIDAQSICVATAATNQVGHEAEIFKAVVWHSIVLAAVVGFITLLQAYVPPFTSLVP